MSRNTGRPPGRPKKSKDPEIEEGTPGGVLENYYGKRNVLSNLSNHIRDRVDPDLIMNFWAMIAEGKNPVWVRNKKGELSGVEPDPNPLQPSPTLEQKAAAVREMSNRGWGQAPQSVHIDAQLKLQIQDEIPRHLLESGSNWRMLDQIRNVMRLEDGNTEDAEWTPVPDKEKPVSEDGVTTQEPSQVKEEEKSSDLVELQEVSHVADTLQEVSQELISSP